MLKGGSVRAGHRRVWPDTDGQKLCGSLDKHSPDYIFKSFVPQVMSVHVSGRCQGDVVVDLSILICPSSYRLILGD